MYQCITDLSDLQVYLSGAPHVAFDFETSPYPAWADDHRAALDPHKAHIVGISFSTAEGSAVYLPTAHMLGKNAAQLVPGEPLTDDEILEKARGSGNGAGFAALREGRWQQEFPSQSEADLALCCKLAFWSGKNREQMDRLFRQSGLMRPKWDDRHHASGATYGEETLARALDTVEEGYGEKSDAPAIALLTVV
jgi:hypothetical protein